MAIFHTRVKVFSRSKGHSAVAAAAYRAGLSLLDALTGIRHDYSHRNGVVANLCLAPKGAPDWAVDPTRVWDAANDADRRKNSALAREFELSLPHELTDFQRLKLVEEIAQALVDRYGFALQASIHAPDPPDGQNHHVHMLATTRRMGPDGLGEKTRELDDMREEGRKQIQWIRALAAGKINAHLAQAGHAVRIDHRRLADQALDALRRGDLEAAAHLSRQPTQHEGKAATAARKRGEVAERCQVNDAIRQANAASFAEKMAQFHKEGRLMPTPASHSHAVAIRDRSPAPPNIIERTVAATAAKAAKIGMQVAPHRVRYRTGDKEADALAAAQREREEEIERLMMECARIYLDKLNEPVRASLAGVANILLEYKALAHIHGPRYRFYADVKGLHRVTLRAQRDSSRFRRRMEAQDRAEHEVAAAQGDLDQFDSKHPRPGLWTRREWAERRRAKTERLLLLRQECEKATKATAPAAQDRYKRQSEESLAALQHTGNQFGANYLTRLSTSLPLLDPTEHVDIEEEAVRTKRGRSRKSAKLQPNPDPVRSRKAPQARL